MAVEIKEVIIRAVLRDEDESENQGAGQMKAGSATHSGMEDNELIEACVEQVLRILRRKNYR